MEIEKVTAGDPIKVAGITVIPVLTTSARCYRLNGSLSVFGTKQPLYIVLAKGSTTKAFRVTGEETPLEELMQEVPYLRLTLDSTQQCSE